MILFGCSMTDPQSLCQALEKNNKKYTIFPLGFSLKDKDIKKRALDNDYLLILSYHDFVKNLELLNSDSLYNKKVVLFSPVVKFNSLNSCTMLDVECVSPKLNSPYAFMKPKFSLLSAKNKVPEKVTVSDFKYLDSLVNEALENSILTKLMTLIYKIPNSKTQNEYRDSIIGWFVNGGSDEDIKKISENIRPKELKNDVSFLVTEYSKYRDVFAHIRKAKNNKAIDYSELSEKMNVNEFDLRYMLSIAAKMEAKILKAKAKNIDDGEHKNGRPVKTQRSKKKD